MDTTISEVINDGTTVFFDDFIEPPVEKQEWESPDQMITHQQSLRDSAILKLKKIGLTEDEAKAVIGI